VQRAAQPGDTLQLTINSRLQKIAQKAVAYGIQVAHNDGEVTAHTGAIVAMNPQNGQILALVSLPTYDNNQFARGISNKDYAKLLNNPDKPLLNHATQAHYPPGSTYKLVAGTGALAGAGLYGVIEAGNAWYLRPTIAFGRTVQPLPASEAAFGKWGAGRMDACKRLPGLYLERRGIQLDMCAGGEIGFVTFIYPSTPNADAQKVRVDAPAGRSLPFLAVGPSLGLRGELVDQTVGLGQQQPELVEQGRRAPDEHPRVPPVLARGEIGLRGRQVRLLLEREHPAHALAVG
jgi:hypothetical protein